MLTLTDAFKKAVLDVVVAAAGPLVGSKVGLYTNVGFIWTPRTKLTDLTEAVYTGYAQQPITWLPSWINPQDQAEAAGDTLVFKPTALLAAPVTITGYFVVDSTGAILQMGDNLPVPVILQQVTDAVPIVPDFTQS